MCLVLKVLFLQCYFLAHSSVKVFVTHGGLHSIEETVSREVPIVGIPFYGDQSENVRKFVALGIGEQINAASITAKKLKEIIVKVAASRMYVSGVASR